MTFHEKKIITVFLKKHKLDQQELFEEFFDHIVTSYENRTEEEQTIDEHLNLVIQPSFGGVKGIKKIKRAQEKARQKLINKRFISIFKEYLFKWPSVAITYSAIIITYLLNSLVDPKVVLIIIMYLGALVPNTIASLHTYRFYQKCKQEGRPYNKSDLHQRVFRVSMFGIVLITVMHTIFEEVVFGSLSKGLQLISQYELIQIALCVFFTLYTLVCLRLFKEKFTLKLAHL